MPRPLLPVGPRPFISLPFLGTFRLCHVCAGPWVCASVRLPVRLSGRLTMCGGARYHEH